MLFAALLCISLLLSCTNNDNGNETSQTYAYCVYSAYKLCTEGPYTTCQGDGIPSNSCPYGSSSSAQPPSSSSIIHGTPVDYEGENYETVVIGSQTWMARNLNYNVAGSKCGSGSRLSDANTTACDTYGRLYNWATAMALPPSCNSSSCSVGSNHQGICPSGWHIPRDAEWTTLTNYVRSSTAGTKLKANSPLWNNNGNGTDDFGFAALPGGYGNSSGNFYAVGDCGDWWSATEYRDYEAYYRFMGYDNEGVNGSYNFKPDLLSVRCLKD